MHNVHKRTIRHMDGRTVIRWSSKYAAILYVDQFIGNNSNLNLRSRPELEILSVNSELKRKISLRYHGSKIICHMK